MYTANSSVACCIYSHIPKSILSFSYGKSEIKSETKRLTWTATFRFRILQEHTNELSTNDDQRELRVLIAQAPNQNSNKPSNLRRNFLLFSFLFWKRLIPHRHQLCTQYERLRRGDLSVRPVGRPLCM